MSDKPIMGVVVPATGGGPAQPVAFTVKPDADPPTRIQKMVRKQIANAIQDDLDGGELIMKEVWEELESDKEEKEAKKEMREIIAWLRSDA